MATAPSTHHPLPRLLSPIPVSLPTTQIHFPEIRGAPWTRSSSIKTTLSATKVTSALIATLRRQRHRLASRLCGSSDDSDVEMDALEAERRMASHQSRMGDRTVGLSTEGGRTGRSRSLSWSRPFQRNTSGASLSTMWDRRLGPDLVVGGAPPSPRNQDWGCCNCGATCDRLEQLCWHCRVHSRCAECEVLLRDGLS